MQVILTTLVYEKQQRLRIIMKMHGLGDGPYWMISYVYYLIISTLYIISLMIFGSAIGNVFSVISYVIIYIYIYQFSELQFLAGLKFFLFNDYSFQFIFCFLYINLQISTAFLVSSAFSKVETASGTRVNSFSFKFAQEHVEETLFFCLMSKL